MTAKQEKLLTFLTTQRTDSRRQIFAWLNAGKIKVNGTAAVEPGMLIDPLKDRIQVNGELVLQSTPNLYIKFHKPKDVMCTMNDPKNRRSIAGLIRAIDPTVVPVGRLDKESAGLIILTNDGDFAHHISHPKFIIPKTYVVTLNREPTSVHLARLSSGFFLEDGEVQFQKVQKVGRCQYAVTITYGRYRIVRRAFDHLGYTVLDLLRIAIGDVQLGKLKAGEHGTLSAPERRSLISS